MSYGAEILMEIVFMCRAKYGIEEMCRDQWNWASKNPYGYASGTNGASATNGATTTD